ncbi:hypothetical protein [Sphingomonas sp.]|uniref:hypothetical protein n=1 Tax=Sphingomonas sp. TaxID=28214 RepID=UPI00286BEF6A|nr:hypothetical protein [Sphingomonas sp.]
MSARSLRPVVAVATVAAAALSCYLVSLRVATERSSLEDIETKIVLAQRDIRTLQTEIGTRGRLEQLERWNVRVLALSAPKAEQFVDGGYQLARLARPSEEIDVNAPVVLASVPQPQPRPNITNDDADAAAATTDPARPAVQHADRQNGGPASMMHVASYSLTTRASTNAETPSTPNKPTVTVAPKPAKIAMAAARPSLPHAAHDAKASSLRDPAKAGSTRDKATH